MKNLIIILIINICSQVNSQSYPKEFDEVSDQFKEKNLFEKANDLYNLKKYDEANILIDKLLKRDSNNIDYNILKGDLLHITEKYKDEIALYNKMIQKFPSNYELRNKYGLLLCTLGQYDYSIVELTYALQLANHDSIRRYIYVNRSVSKSSARDFESAYNDLMKAYKIDSNSIAVLTNLGHVCDEIGKGDETLNYLLRAIKIDSNFYPAYGNIGFKYQHMGNHKKAIEYYNKVISFNDKEPLGYSNRSYSLLKLGDTAGAMKDINYSIYLYPANSYAYMVKAKIYIEMKDYIKACENIAIALDKNYVTSYGNDILQLKKDYCK